jgi:pyruvate-formate lyase
VNVVSTETLRDAQLHPEQYGDLLVRISGFSARFVELTRQTQDEIIARSEQS